MAERKAGFDSVVDGMFIGVDVIAPPVKEAAKRVGKQVAQAGVTKTVEIGERVIRNIRNK